MSRADRRHRTDLKIAQREAIARRCLTGVVPAGHRWHKTEQIGHCSNRGCWLCACERHMKHEAVKRSRREGREQERDVA